MNKLSELIVRLLPAVRISFGLVLITASILLVGDLLGFAPDPFKPTMDARKKISESLAIQFSTLAAENDLSNIRATLKVLVGRNDDILSAGLRDMEGNLKLEAGSHSVQWGASDQKKSTATHVVVPIFKGKKQWGSVEVVFASLASGLFEGLTGNPVYKLLLFVAGLGFLSYLFIIFRTLRELDPSAVIPERVNAAFDTLAEGVLILDEKEQIVLANKAFAENLERSPKSLIGIKASELNWSVDPKEPIYPWKKTLQDSESQIGTAMVLNRPAGGTVTMMVNSAAICDSDGKGRGVLATFDDVTELEQKNDQLQGMVTELEETQEAVKKQNKELHFLATQDPLTGCLNRRAFNEKFDKLFSQAREDGTELTCIMADIDHFKAVNDTYGHQTGDKVIKLLADILHSNTRKEDVVGRYGGEEFCIVLPGIDVEEAVAVAERIRLRIKEDSAKTFSSGPRVTASLGVSSIRDDAKDPAELNSQSDKALYVAKETGRNRVIKWDRDQVEKAEQEKEAASNSASTPAPTVDNSVESVDNPSTDLQAAGEVNRLQVRIKQLEGMASKYSEELQYKKSYDSLTGLANQVLFFDRIQQAIARGRRHDQIVAVLTLDIDLFKRVNNTLGREAGDRLLKELAARLMRILRDTDGVTLFGSATKDVTVSRLGADEFGLLLTDLNEMQAVTWIVKRIFETLSKPIEIDEQQIFVSCNIGISLYPQDANTPETLLDQAGVARQYAKQMPGQNNYQLFDHQMHRVSLEQMQVESEMRRAIENEEFILYYQPKMDMESAAIYGVEALIRWDHPTKGVLAPYEFIEVAEQSGLIVPIGEWVLKQACLQTKAWIAMGMTDIRVAVNLSTVQLRQKNFADRVLKIVEDMELQPQHLELEITETVIMDNLDTAVDTLNHLHSRGFGIAIDDFGTGYSSLNYLKHLPLDTLKIDRSFLQDILTDGYDKTIVKTIIAMAHSMDLSVTAEGVETQDQLMLLRQFSCDQIQGYLFSRPIPAMEVTELLLAKTHPEFQFAS